VAHFQVHKPVLGGDFGAKGALWVLEQVVSMVVEQQWLGNELGMVGDGSG